ncbi:hypothetical protein VNI00_009359 [Paramarasmius palmivorus]|uniref:DUF6699 domain-containing protein n=1 Tax=Paramarasmius palmivorus TaxID=297713 RepID=A0AAW0CTL0_9AGAR
MSGPYVFRPTTTPSAYYNPGFHTPQGSPFIPSATLPGSTSPYHSPYRNSVPLPGSSSPYHSPYRNAVPLPGTPNTPNRVLFPGTYESNDPYDPYFGPARPRRPSWHAPIASPYLSSGEDTYFRERRRSFSGAAPYDAGPAYPYAWAAGFGGPYAGYASSSPNYGGSSPYGMNHPLPGLPSTPGTFHLHPWLNAEAWQGDFVFDLSSHYFNPIQVLSRDRNGLGQTRLAPMDIMMQQATVPGVTRMRVICDMIPQWPIDISYNDSMGGGNMGAVAFAPDPLAGTHVPPISMLDVLMCIHRSLHTRITHADWARLDSHLEAAVSRAYTQRCKALGHQGSQAYIGANVGFGAYGPDVEAAELAQGVKRVDFLLGKVWFRGGVVDWTEGVIKLITA